MAVSSFPSSGQVGPRHQMLRNTPYIPTGSYLNIPPHETGVIFPEIPGFLRAQIVTALPGSPPLFPHALPAPAAVPFVLAGRGAVSLSALREKRFPADGAELCIWRRPFLTDGFFQYRIQREYILTKIAAERARPTFPQHVAGTVQWKAGVLSAVIIGAPGRDQLPNLLSLVTGQLPAHSQCFGPGWPEAPGCTIKVRNFFRHLPFCPRHSFR